MAIMLEAVVFDVGNVLFRYEPQRILDRLLPDSPHHEVYLKELIQHDRWQRLDRGDLNESLLKEEMLEQGSIQPEQWGDVEMILGRFVEYLIPVPETIACFSTWELPIYILSNFQDDPFRVLCEQYSFMNRAQGMVVSARERCSKPERAIYQILLDRYALNPAKTLFIDDLPENIQQAKKMGIQGICFQSPEQLKMELNPYHLVWPEMAAI